MACHGLRVLDALPEEHPDVALELARGGDGQQRVVRGGVDLQHYAHQLDDERREHRRPPVVEERQLQLRNLPRPGSISSPVLEVVSVVCSVRFQCRSLPNAVRSKHPIVNYITKHYSTTLKVSPNTVSTTKKHPF